MLDKLEAVNRSLQAIGESRVNSLNSGLPDAAEAEVVLDEVKDEVLQVGWYENTRDEVKVQPDAQTGEIVVPSTWYNVETTYKSASIGKVVTKVDPNDNQRKLFEVNEQTYVFEEDVYLKVIMSMEFDDMTYPLRNYVSAKAARVFQERIMGSVSLDSFTARAEHEAWAKLLDAEAEVAENNALYDSPYMREITGRNNRLTWR